MKRKPTKTTTYIQIIPAKPPLIKPKVLALRINKEHKPYSDMGINFEGLRRKRSDVNWPSHVAMRTTLKPTMRIMLKLRYIPRVTCEAAGAMLEVWHTFSSCRFPRRFMSLESSAVRLTTGPFSSNPTPS